MNKSPILTVALSLTLGADFAAAQTRTNQIEPRAGTWKTWVLSSGSELRVPTPPNKITLTAPRRNPMTTRPSTVSVAGPE